MVLAQRVHLPLTVKQVACMTSVFCGKWYTDAEKTATIDGLDGAEVEWISHEQPLLMPIGLLRNHPDQD